VSESAESWLDPRLAAKFDGGFDLARYTIGAAYMGSHSHNTYVPKDDPDSIDDVDIMGVVVPPPARQIGLREWEHWTEQFEELDATFYSLRKFIGLLLKCNPNVVGLLWLKPDLYLRVHPAFRRLIEQRDVFSSKIAFDAFAGYASAQIKKMQSQAFQGYMGAKRKELVERLGYDAKNAAHAIRLLRMGTEFLETGALRVFREDDAEEIRSIKRGEWSLEQVQAEAERGFTAAGQAFERSTLPDRPDFDAAERLLLDMTLNVWREQSDI
jgi:predicted nucleotidyltransferase